MPAKTLQDLLLEELRDIYHAENQLLKTLPRLAKAATAPELRQAFETHHEETQVQIERLERIFDEMDARKSGKRCAAMEGLVEEAREIMEMGLPPEMLDVALIAAAQKAEHYEIASYGSLHAYAEACGLQMVAELLYETLEEEKRTDALLNRIAIENVNQKALRSGQAA